MELVSQLEKVETYIFVDGTKTELSDVLQVLSEKTRLKSKGGGGKGGGNGVIISKIFVFYRISIYDCTGISDVSKSSRDLVVLL